MITLICLVVKKWATRDRERAISSCTSNALISPSALLSWEKSIKFRTICEIRAACSSTTSNPVALLLADLGIMKMHSRPHVSNDNPYSEAQFKTLKYRPDFPRRFGSIEHARNHSADFFPWYNTEHHHSGLGYLTPHDVHHGLAAQRRAERTVVLARAYAEHPERFTRGTPRPPALPKEVWINKPAANLSTLGTAH